MAKVKQAIPLDDVVGHQSRDDHVAMNLDIAGRCSAQMARATSCNWRAALRGSVKTAAGARDLAIDAKLRFDLAR